MLQNLLLVFWTMVILLMTCTTRFELENKLLQVYFSWNSNPEFGDLFLALPAELTEPFILQKVGHLIAFVILGFLLKIQTNNIKTILFIISFAILTEFLQLYLSRGGRLFDVGFDLIGGGLGIAVGALIQNIIAKEQNPSTLKR
ncbi:VanZ family protein [Heyndrickxia sp. MSNUG]|uniref:VanZ family protein n=1 Tax=Heyndrickxia sp. MSNUG TaxID=3136677 RepID=UPI003C2DEA7E